MENLKKIIKQFPKVGEVKEIKALTSDLSGKIGIS